MGILDYFRGEMTVSVLGAEVEGLLNRLAERNVAFWSLKRIDPLRCTMHIYEKDQKTVQTIARKSFCEVEISQISKRKRHWGIVKGRPVLVLGVLLAILLTFAAQSVVFSVRIDGNEVLHDEEILRALEELGIGIGLSADVDQQLTKHRMMNLLPELSWIGVNRSGFQLNVLVTERSFASTNRPNYPAANLVASRNCVLTEMIVSEGQSLVTVGDVVSEGQTLVSGLEDYGLTVRAVCAEGEIYGQTWYSGIVAAPVTTGEKHYTGKEWTKYSLIIGRKRINLSGNSSFSGASCDKIVSVTELSLSDAAFPVRLEKVTLREYTLVETQSWDAEARLQEAWRELLLSQMIAGEILSTDFSFRQFADVYLLHAESTCKEMVARYEAIDPISEGEPYE